MSTGKVRPGTWRVGHPPKYSEIFSASTVADMRIILIGSQKLINQERVRSYLRSGRSSMRDFRTIKRKSDSIDRSWTSSMTICFSRSGQGDFISEVLRETHSNLIESSSLPSLTGPALQHSKCNAVGDKCKSSISRGIAL